MEEKFDTAGNMDNDYEVLKLLCRLVNNIKSGSVRKINASKIRNRIF